MLFPKWFKNVLQETSPFISFVFFYCTGYRANPIGHFMTKVQMHIYQRLKSWIFKRHCWLGLCSSSLLRKGGNQNNDCHIRVKTKKWKVLLVSCNFIFYFQTQCVIISILLRCPKESLKVEVLSNATEDKTKYYQIMGGPFLHFGGEKGDWNYFIHWLFFSFFFSSFLFPKKRLIKVQLLLKGFKLVYTYWTEIYLSTYQT